MTSQLDAIKKTQVDKEIIRWLSPPDPSTNHNLMSESHHPGTGEWHLRSDTFKDWRTTNASFFLLSGCDGISVVLDALDECPEHTERAKVLTVIEELVSWKLDGFHLYVTSRPEHDIRMRIGLLVTDQVNLHLVDQQAEDINSYVRHVLQQDPVFRTWRPSDTDLAIRTLTEKANGMFRWVFCQLQALKDCLPKHIRSTLKNLPKTLDETYQRILEGIPENLSQDALHLFQCLAFSMKPFTIEELADILAVDLDADPVPIFISSYRPSTTQVLQICSGLVVLNNELVQFAHFSVQEYLVSERLSKTE
ncbi:hypothetical protein OF83DRAFT_1060548, partial [Amylostereum chailletii]